MSRITIIGGTGYAGAAIARDALSRGHDVVAVGRSAVPADLPVGAAYVQGSIHDADLLDGLAAHSDVLVVAVHAISPGDPGLIAALPALIAASGAHGTRLGVVGGAGSLLHADGTRHVDDPNFPAQFRPEALAHAEVLDALRSGAGESDWFYVSPAALFGSYAPGEATGAYRTGIDELVTDESGSSEISGADFALAFVDEIETPKHHRERFSVGH